MPDTHALSPGPVLFAFRGAIISGDHASLRAVHEKANACALVPQSVVKRADQVRTANALTGSDHFRVHGVIDERGQRLARGVDSLDNVAAGIVEAFRVIIVCDLS